MATTTKKDSIQINKINGFDIYLDPANGRFFFSLPNSRERVEFETLRAAEDAARGDKPPVKVIVVGRDTYRHPEVVEVIGFSGWSLLTAKYRKLDLYRVFAYDKDLLDKLNAAAEACDKAHQQWQWAVEEFARAKRAIEMDWQGDHYKTAEGHHKRAEGGILRVE